MQLLRDQRGHAATIFALASLPLFGAAGFAVDYGRQITYRDALQIQSDRAALSAAAADQANVAATALAAARTELQSRYGHAINDIDVAGGWISGADYQVTISARVPNTIMTVLPGVQPTALISVQTVVNRIPQQFKTEPPALSQLSPEAADYNRLYMYCYDPKRAGEADKGRRAMTAIADNGTPGLDYSKNPLPQCEAGELISYKLRNVRNARSDPKKWDAKKQEVYEYYTDTTIDPDTRVQTNHMSGGRVYDNGSVTPVNMDTNPILETILCDTESACRPKSEGGTLPNNHETNRTPGTASGSCVEGKLLYFGWEDRPPNGGSDRDYDDIRLIVKCPKTIKTADKQLRIVK